MKIKKKIIKDTDIAKALNVFFQINKTLGIHGFHKK